MLNAIVVSIRFIVLIFGGQKQVALENAALRQQLHDARGAQIRQHQPAEVFTVRVVEHRSAFGVGRQLKLLNPVVRRERNCRHRPGVSFQDVQDLAGVSIRKLGRTVGTAAQHVPTVTRDNSAADYDIAEIPDDTMAREFILQHHCAGFMDAARVRVGLYRRWPNWRASPCSRIPARVLYSRGCFLCPRQMAVELGHFVLLYEIEAKIESFSLRGRSKFFAAVGLPVW